MISVLAVVALARNIILLVVESPKSRAKPSTAFDWKSAGLEKATPYDGSRYKEPTRTILWLPNSFSDGGAVFCPCKVDKLVKSPYVPPEGIGTIV